MAFPSLPLRAARLAWESHQSQHRIPGDPGDFGRLLDSVAAVGDAVETFPDTCLGGYRREDVLAASLCRDVLARQGSSWAPRLGEALPAGAVELVEQLTPPARLPEERRSLRHLNAAGSARFYLAPGASPAARLIRLVDLAGAVSDLNADTRVPGSTRADYLRRLEETIGVLMSDLRQSPWYRYSATRGAIGHPECASQPLLCPSYEVAFFPLVRRCHEAIQIARADLS